MNGPSTTPNVVVIGAGVGGLTVAAALAKAGVRVSVLESHVYPGGCAGTFYNRGYRFDAGATLAGGFYPGGPMDILAKTVGIDEWPVVEPSDMVMAVHLPGVETIEVWGGNQRHEARRKSLGDTSSNFWIWQEATADAIWDLALRLPHWPPQSIDQGIDLINKVFEWIKEDYRRLRPALFSDALRKIASHLIDTNDLLRLFVDSQLLISSQTISQNANALYGAAALDLPRRGVVHLKGGIGSIAQTLANTIERHGGSVYYRQEVKRVTNKRKQPLVIQTKRGLEITADILCFNLTPWSINSLVDGDIPNSIKSIPSLPYDSWGAFTLYLGVDDDNRLTKMPLHHQVVRSEPLGETNSVFISISPAWDETRAPKGKRAITMSTHTKLNSWWDSYQHNPFEYEELKKEYSKKMINAANEVIPGLEEKIRLLLPGTPITFNRFTRRYQGWVGGFPQTNLFRNWGPKLSSNIWMVGDSIFPGQSIAAVALGGLRVANSIIKEFR